MFGFKNLANRAAPRRIIGVRIVVCKRCRHFPPLAAIDGRLGCTRLHNRHLALDTPVRNIMRDDSAVYSTFRDIASEGIIAAVEIAALSAERG